MGYGHLRQTTPHIQPTNTASYRCKKDNMNWKRFLAVIFYTFSVANVVSGMRSDSDAFVPAGVLLGAFVGLLAFLYLVDDSDDKEEEPDELPPLSKFKTLEIYEWHDKPLLVLAEGDTGGMFLGVMIKEDKFVDVWIYAGLDDEQFARLKGGTLDERETFRSATGGHVWLTKNYTQNDSWSRPVKVSIKALTEDMLPTPEAGYV